MCCIVAGRNNKQTVENSGPYSFPEFRIENQWQKCIIFDLLNFIDFCATNMGFIGLKSLFMSLCVIHK